MCMKIKNIVSHRNLVLRFYSYMNNSPNGIPDGKLDQIANVKLMHAKPVVKNLFLIKKFII